VNFCISFILAIFASAALLYGAPVEPVHRVWTDSNGRKAEMALVDIEGDTAEFRMSDGRSLKLPLAKLSAADQRFIRGLEAQGAGATSGNREWPDTVKVDARDIEIELVEENPDKQLAYVYRTANFEFHSEADLGIAVMRDVGRVFEATRELLIHAPWNIDPQPPGDRFLAELYETMESYVAAGGPSNSGGVFIPHLEKFMAPFQSLGLKPVGKRYGMSPNYSVATLVHELTHQMMREWLPVLPPWFVEGSAEYTSSFPYNAGKFRCGGIKTGLKDYVKERMSQGLPPNVDKVDALLTMTNTRWQEVAASGYRAQSELYYDSFLLLYFFMHLDGEGKPFWKWLDAVRATKRELDDYARAMEAFVKQEDVEVNKDGSFFHPPDLKPPSPPDILDSRKALETAGSKHMEILMDGRTAYELKKQIRDAYKRIGIR